MENTLKKNDSSSKQTAYREEMKALLIKNGAKIRPIIGSGRGQPSEVKQLLKELQAEVKAELKEIDHAIYIVNMPVEKTDENTWKAGYPAHEHIVKRFISDLDGKETWWCYECPGYLNYKHCSHVDAVKLKREGIENHKLEEF